jgi:hypothetical protein
MVMHRGGIPESGRAGRCEHLPGLTLSEVWDIAQGYPHTSMPSQCRLPNSTRARE